MMKKYFIEKKEKRIVNDRLFGQVEQWNVVETVEYPDETSWENAKRQIGIPDVCWLIQGDISWTAYVEYEK